MSSVHPYPTQMEDRECIVAGIQQLGFNPTVLEPGRTKALRGWGSGNGRSIGESAEIIIPKEQISWASNDIGFRREQDGKFTLIGSAADVHSELGPEWVIKMKQAYSEQKLMKLYRANGYTQFERREVKTPLGIEIAILAKTPEEMVQTQSVQLGSSL